MRHTRAAIPVLTILVSPHCPAESMPPVPTRGIRTLRIFLCTQYGAKLLIRNIWGDKEGLESAAMS